MDRSILLDRDALARHLNLYDEDILWSYDPVRGVFRWALGDGDLIAFPGGEHDAGAPSRRMAEETESFAKGLASGRAEPPHNCVLRREIHFKYRGGEFHAEIAALFVSPHDGPPRSLIGITRNTTRQKRLENALTKSESLYRTLLKTSPDAILVIDAEGDIIKSNNRAEKLLGEPRSDMIGKNCGEFLAGAGIAELKKMAHDAGEKETAEAAEFEIRRADGTTFTGEMTVSVMEEGSAEGDTFIAVLRDVTKKKKAERELAKSSERYELLIDSMNEGLVIIDKNGLFVYINRSATVIFEYTFEELLGRPAESVMDRENRKVLKTMLDHSRKPLAADRDFELSIKRKSGDRADLVLFPKGIYGRGGDYLGTFAVVTDVTEMKNARDERNRLADEIITIFLNRLSDREKELLSFLNRGYQWPSQKREICRLMDVFPGTLDKFMARIKKKLEMDDIHRILQITRERLP